MRIVYVSALPESIGGGETKVAFDMARRMSKLHEVVIVHPAIDGQAKIYTENGLKKYAVESEWKGDFYAPKLSFDVLSNLKQFLGKYNPDIVHTHSPVMLGQVMQNWAVDNQVPFVYTSHFMPTQMHAWIEVGTYSNLTPKLLDNSLMRGYLELYYNSCNAVVALNQEAADDIRKAGYNGKIAIIPGGLDLKLFNNIPIQSITAQDEIKLIFVGSLSPRKNQDFLLSVMEHLPGSYKLLLVGHAQDQKYLERLNEHIKSAKLHNVEIVGKVPFEQLPSIYEQCHILVSASKAEVQALGVVEGMVAGKPVVCLENQTTREIVTPQNGVNLKLRTSPKRFAEAILELVKQGDAAYQNMAQAARDSTAMFEYGRVLESTVALYNEVLDARHRFKDDRWVSRRILATGVILGALGAYSAFKVYNKIFSKDEE